LRSTSTMSNLRELLPGFKLRTVVMAISSRDSFYPEGYADKNSPREPESCRAAAS
jgi:hypothetical protein